MALAPRAHAQATRPPATGKAETATGTGAKPVKPAATTDTAKSLDAKSLDAKQLDVKSSPRPVAAVPLDKYEDAYLRVRVARHGLTLEPNPEGKLIEDIIVETEEVFDQADQGKFSKIPIVGVLPKYSNYLHATTRRYIVARELLFAVGEPYRKALIAETERNLRALAILAIGRIAACKGSAPNTVRVVVATKDLWSLRLESDFAISNGRIDFLKLNIVERNLAGRNKIVSANIGLTRDEFSLGQTFIEPRLLGTRIALEESASLVFGRGGRGIEGGTGYLSVGQPLFSLASKWGFEVATGFETGVTRVFRGSDFFRCFPFARAGAPVLCDNEIRTAAERARLLSTRDSVTPLYASRVVTFGAGAVRRFGDINKHDFSFGYGLRHRAYELAGDYPSDVVRDAVRSLFVPRSEDASYIYAGYRSFSARYATLKNINRFALTEDYQYGHDVRFLSRWGNKIFGIDNAFVELDGSAQYRWLFHGGEDLFTVSARVQSRGERGELVNNRFSLLVSNVSPVLGIGRLIAEASAIFRFQDRDNVRSTLGGNSGLRGYESDEFRGRHMVNLHLEYRSLPADLLTVQMGFVAFYDVGHAADELSQLKPRHAVGVGLRVFFPQVNRMVIRADYGIPLSDGGPTGFGQQFSFSFDQAF